MKRLGLAFLLTLLGLACAQAQQVNPPLDQGATACAFNSVLPTITTGNYGLIQCDANGRLLLVSTPATGSTQQVVGNVASGVADSGNPVKVGGIFNTTLPIITNGQRVDLQTDSRGNLRVATNGVTTPGADGVVNAGNVSFGQQTTSLAGPLNVAPSKFNGATWDRDFTCTSSAVVNVTAAATTEIVALTAAQTIRVCSFVTTISLSGTAQFVYGTGTNCGTGTTNLTGAMALATASPVSISSGNGSLFRTASANALCLSAVTGNVTGFVTYAKY